MGAFKLYIDQIVHLPKLRHIAKYSTTNFLTLIIYEKMLPYHWAVTPCC